jgi:hypothetical protein
MRGSSPRMTDTYDCASKLHLFPRKREARDKDWVPAFAGTSG